MFRIHPRKRTYTFAALIAALVTAAGCAAPGPTIRIDRDPSIDLSAYRTFGFVSEPGTDRGGYSTLITTHFKDAVRREMTERGYEYTEDRPDLLVNFYANARERIDVRSRPVMGYGYYGYRYGLYTAWPLYGMREYDTVTYRVGTVNIDVVDANKRQLVWEGVAEGRIREQHVRDPRSAISDVVAELMQDYPRASPM